MLEKVAQDHTEQFGQLYHEAHLKQIKERPYLWGTHVWNMFDFAVTKRDEGEHKGQNNKGLMTIDHFATIADLNNSLRLSNQRGQDNITLIFKGANGETLESGSSVKGLSEIIATRNAYGLDYMEVYTVK